MHDADAPLEDSVPDGALATAGAPSRGGVQSSCCVAVSRRAARAPRPAAARRPEQRALAPREGKLGKDIP